MTNSVTTRAGISPAQLRALRLKLDLTQDEMAEKLLMSKVMYGLNERGKKPISDRTSALALILQTSVRDS